MPIWLGIQILWPMLKLERYFVPQKVFYLKILPFILISVYSWFFHWKCFVPFCFRNCDCLEWNCEIGVVLWRDVSNVRRGAVARVAELEHTSLAFKFTLSRNSGNWALCWGQMSLSKLPSFSVVGDANGWAPEDMFATNEREYGVQTTFKENLEGYTVPLNTDKSSEEYRYTLAVTYCCLKDKLS